MSGACPKCGVDLTFQSDGRTYSRKIGIELDGIYDGVLYWQCPACGGRWHRFSENAGRLYRAADEFVNPKAVGPE